MWQFHKKSRNNKKEIIIKRKTNYYLRKIFYACTHTHTHTHTHKTTTKHISLYIKLLMLDLE